MYEGKNGICPISSDNKLCVFAFFMDAQEKFQT